MKMVKAKSYELASVNVRSFKGANYLSLLSLRLLSLTNNGETVEMIQEDHTEHGIVKEV